jgi:phosphonate transport system substrate-binding protein
MSRDTRRPRWRNGPGKALAATVLGCLTVTVAACGGGGDAEAGAEETPMVRFASTDVEGLEELQRDFEAFQQTLSETAGVELEFFPVPSRTAAAEALQGEQLDFVLTGPAEYVAISARTGAQPVVGILRPTYRSCIMTSQEAGVEETADLRGETVAFTDVGSTSGHLGPSVLLAEAGLGPVEESVEAVFIGDGPQQVAALERGDVAAIAAECDDFVDLAEDDPEAFEGFELIAEGEVLPPDVIMAGDHVPEEVIEQVRAAFEAQGDEIVASITESTTGGRPKYTDPEVLPRVQDGDYDQVREGYQAAGIDPAEFEE